MEVTYPKTTTENCKTIGEKAMLQTILDECFSVSIEPANRQAYRLARATTAKLTLRSMVVVAVRADGLLDLEKSGYHCHTTGEDRYNWQQADIYTVSRWTRMNGEGPSAVDCSTCPLAGLPTRDNLVTTTTSNYGKNPIEMGRTSERGA
ncbi:hypothetical protein ASPBRDRAFT_59704 [Aspergillus brasiliensis CBS 101740]|uniref:Uncharacterized protein n=1 Tax=Aspergillus brasiliensis (strain CBS 101740 / IMI 381727 / IBT 21946) TaxID=767769 RepID=A0A1L9U4L0_ASPBC|nr:hypothetical protein ASPBRDRAFT_59704 [Aspergillus brasiliensis CBS 101740]